MKSNLTDMIINHKKSLSLALGSGLVLASVVGLAAPPALADDFCVSVNPTITMTSAASQTGNPGDTLTYTMDVTNNDSLSCAPAELTVAPANSPAGWSAGYTPSAMVYVDPQQTVPVSVSYTSSAGAYNGAYDLYLDITKYQPYAYGDLLPVDNPFTVRLNLVYELVNGAPDNVAPVVSIIAPNDGQVFKRNSVVTIAAQATDNVAVSQLEYK